MWSWWDNNESIWWNSIYLALFSRDDCFPNGKSTIWGIYTGIYLYIIKYNITIYYIIINIYIYVFSFCGTQEANPRIDRSDRYLITRKLEYFQQTWELRQRCIWGGRLFVEVVGKHNWHCRGSIGFLRNWMQGEYIHIVKCFLPFTMGLTCWTYYS